MTGTADHRRHKEAVGRTEFTASVLVVSTSAAGGLANDHTGPVIRTWLQQRGFGVGSPRIVSDGAAVGHALREEVRLGTNVVITTGGTGIAPDDMTPEQTAPLLDVQLPGLLEALRRTGEQNTSLALLTRGVAGFAGSTFIINLPGSRAAVADGLDLLDQVLDHLLEQRSNGSGHHDASREILSDHSLNGDTA